MKTRVIYQCEICRRESESREAIEQCEARGRPDLSLCPPLGLIVGSACGPGPCSCGSHLCGAGHVSVVQWTGTDDDKHGFCVRAGLFRGNGCGDTADFSDNEDARKATGFDHLLFGPTRRNPNNFQRWQDWPEPRPCPAFWRAVKALRRAGWTPYVLRNGEAVSFQEPTPVGVAEELMALGYNCAPECKAFRIHIPLRPLSGTVGRSSEG